MSSRGDGSSPSHRRRVIRVDNNTPQPKREGKNSPAVPDPNSPKARRAKRAKFTKRMVKIGVVFLILGLLGGGTGIGVLAAWMSDAPPIDIDAFRYVAPSVIRDVNGDFYQELQSVERRIPVSIDEVPEMVQNAFISMEDQRYYAHEGIDIRGTVKAVLSVLRTGATEGPGGSTITQQVIKQTHLTSTKTLARKVQEWKLAFGLDRDMSKRQIMEIYLNEANMAITYGIGSAAQLYFGKDVHDLTVAQAAVLTAIVNLPAVYNPYEYETADDGTRRIAAVTDSDGNVLKLKYSAYNRERAEEVVYKMYELGHISKREYELAMRDLRENLIELKKPNLNTSQYSYYTDAVITTVCKDMVSAGLMESETEALRALSIGGYRIDSCVDPLIQGALEHAANNNKLFPDQSSEAKKFSDASNQKYADDPNYEPVNLVPQVGAAVIQNSTGRISGLVGGRGVKTGMLTENRALQQKQIGSTTKPITIYSPGFDKGILTLATTFDNVRMDFQGFKPVNFPATYTGMTSCREGIKNSINVIAVYGYYKVGYPTAMEYGRKFGFTFDEEHDIGAGALALGGYTYGQTPVQLASAFTVFPNGGWRLTPILYTTVSYEGKVILDTSLTQERVQVISKEAAWLTTSAMKEVVNGGTADLKISGQEVAGKTGTTAEKYATLFAGFTAEYSGGVHYGYDYAKRTINGKTYCFRIGDTNGRSGRGPSPAIFWEAVFKEFYDTKNLKKASLPSMPDTIQAYSIDTVSGKRPTELSVLAGTVGSEYFMDGTYPAQSDDIHQMVAVCAYTGLLPGPGCPLFNKVMIVKTAALYPSGCKPVGNPKPENELEFLPPTEYCSGVHYITPVTPPVVTPPVVTPPITTPTPPEDSSPIEVP